MPVVAAVVGKRDRLCVQEEPFEAEFLRFTIRVIVPVAFVPQNRVLGMIQMNPDLVSTPGLRRT